MFNLDASVARRTFAGMTALLKLKEIMTEYCSVYITASDTGEAAWIAKVLVQERLLACANIVPAVQSVYWWDGKIQNGEESIIIGKTHQDLLPLLAMRVRDVHSYETPCITATPLSYIEPEYEKWLAASLSP